MLSFDSPSRPSVQSSVNRHLVARRVKQKISDMAFSVAASCPWNQLPTDSKTHVFETASFKQKHLKAVSISCCLWPLDLVSACVKGTSGRTSTPFFFVGTVLRGHVAWEHVINDCGSVIILLVGNALLDAFCCCCNVMKSAMI